MHFHRYLPCGLFMALSCWGSVQAATWQSVAAGRGERVEIDTSRISLARDGRTLAWTRLTLAKEMPDEQGGTYDRVEALNSYDCESGRFLTVKRLYLKGEHLLRVEPVYAPKEIPASGGAVDQALLTQACQAKRSGSSDGLAKESESVRKLAERASQIASAQREKEAGGDARPAFGVMHAEMVTDGSAKTRPMTVADSGTKTDPKPDTRAEAKPEAKGGDKAGDKAAAGSASADKGAEAPRRFIQLPHIDRSQLERPTDEPKAAMPADAKADGKSDPKGDPKAGDPKAAVKAALKSQDLTIAPIERHSRELELATSGPRRVSVAKRKIPAPAPAEVPAAVDVHRSIHWSYEGEGAPANWGGLRPDYATCDTGKRQSPIDIREGIRVEQEPIKFDYKPGLFRIVDNGHTIQVRVAEGNTISVMGRTYQLIQFHFHKPSEERVNGKASDMVVHLVHKDEEDRLAVVAVLLEKGTEHPLIQTLWNNLPLETEQELAPSKPIDLNTLLPENRAYYAYMGSLTTPPCTEGVLWLVFKQPMTLSSEQVSVFSRLYRNNARPVQPANGRLIKESR